MKISIEDNNYIVTDDLIFNLEKADITQNAQGKNGELFISFIVSGNQVLLPFFDVENRKVFFEEIKRRKLVLTQGKEAFARYLKEMAKAQKPAKEKA